MNLGMHKSRWSAGVGQLDPHRRTEHIVSSRPSFRLPTSLHQGVQRTPQGAVSMQADKPVAGPCRGRQLACKTNRSRLALYGQRRHSARFDHGEHALAIGGQKALFHRFQVCTPVLLAFRKRVKPAKPQPGRAASSRLYTPRHTRTISQPGRRPGWRLPVHRRHIRALGIHDAAFLDARDGLGQPTALKMPLNPLVLPAAETGHKLLAIEPCGSTPRRNIPGTRHRAC